MWCKCTFFEQVRYGSSEQKLKHLHSKTADEHEQLTKMHIHTVFDMNTHQPTKCTYKLLAVGWAIKIQPLLIFKIKAWSERFAGLWTKEKVKQYKKLAGVRWLCMWNHTFWDGVWMTERRENVVEMKNKLLLLLLTTCLNSYLALKTISVIYREAVEKMV